jgi:hypothetical protein
LFALVGRQELSIANFD